MQDCNHENLRKYITNFKSSSAMDKDAFEWKDPKDIWKGVGIYHITFVVSGRKKEAAGRVGGTGGFPCL